MKSYEERIESSYEKAKILKSKQKRTKRILAAATATACACLLTAVNLVLFMPLDQTPKISAYKDSEYYGVIEKIDELTNTSRLYKNNFDKWFGDIEFDFNKGFGAASPDTSFAPETPGSASGNDGANGSDSANGEYNEVTDNQVSGVIEGDLFKRTDKYIFYLSYANSYGAYLLKIYSIDKADSEEVANFTITAEEGTTFSGYQAKREMYLSGDGRVVTVITPAYSSADKILYTEMINIDVSDLTDIKIAERLYVSGNYVSSRLTEKGYLLITQYSVKNDPDFSDEKAYLPQTGEWDDLKSVAAADIIYPETPAYARYTVVCAVDGGLTVNGSCAFLSYSEDVYVSQENIYTMRTYTAPTYEQDGVTYYNETRTEISRVSYADGLEYKGSATVKGSVLNQYSLDEYEGVLRAAATVSYTSTEKNRVTNASLYCLDTENFNIVGALEEFAPDGEEVTSARFDKETAYICTAEIIILTDPVYAIDLSDPANPVSKDTGVIKGYSIALRTFADDTLLGIGYGDNTSELKIELYSETDGGVESVAQYTRDATFSTTYKAYFIDAENALIGLGIYDLQDRANYYLLLRFDGYNLVEVFNDGIVLSVNAYDYTRATYIDGWLYILNGTDFKAVEI